MMKKLTVFLLLFLGIAWPLAAVPRADLDLSLVPPVVNTRPGPEYQDEARRGAMIIGMDRTPRGRIWACWTGTGDNAESYFILATSDDDGTTWSKPRVVIDPKDTPGKPPLRSLVGNLWCDPTGRLWLFFDQSLGVFDGRAGDWFITCDNPDAAEPVWSQPVRFADGCTLNKPTVLKNGEWLLPVSLWHRQHIIPSLFKEEYQELDSQRMAHVYISTNQGKSWTRRGGVVIPKTDFDEHTIVERRDGQLWMLARTLYGVAESFSSDAGRTWSEPQPSAIKNVSARMFIRRLASGRLLLVKNGPTDQRLPGRSHMSAFLSDDDGKTWSGSLLLDERSGVSYPDGFQSPDGLIHILYDRNRHTDAEILLAKFRETDVLAGKFVSPDAKPQMLADKARGKRTAWTFETPGDFQGWQPAHDLTNCAVTEGALTGLTTHIDPYFVSPLIKLPAGGFSTVVVRMKLELAGGESFIARGAKLYWTTSKAPAFCPESGVGFETIGDGQWHDYEMSVSQNPNWTDTVTRLRIDPCMVFDVKVAIDSVRLKK